MKKLASFMTGPRGRGAGYGRRGLRAALLLLPLLLAAGCSDEEGNVTFPPPPPPPSMPWLFDVYGTAANDVYVGGNRGVMFHYDGAGWTQVDVGTDQAITCIWGPGDGVLYACGHGGLILRQTSEPSAVWAGMSSGTTKDLYALGSYQDQIHAVGFEGAARRLNGGTWEGAPVAMVVRNPLANDAAVDTLDLRQDVASLLTVNHFFIGGAYKLPDYRGAEIGRNGTDGMVIGEDLPPPDDPKFPWQLRPLRGDEIATVEWVYCTTSDDILLSNNYLGTSEGWLFQLTEDVDRPGRKTWRKFDVRITVDRNTGIRDMWLDTNGDLYMVTDGGRIIYRNSDGTIRELYNGLDALVGIWGASAGEFWVTGYIDEMILRCSYDPVADTFTATPVTLEFPE